MPAALRERRPPAARAPEGGRRGRRRGLVGARRSGPEAVDDAVGGLRFADTAAGLGRHGQRHQVLVRPGGDDDVAPRGVERHLVLPVGALDERRRQAVVVGERGVGVAPGRQLLAVDVAVGDGLLRIEITDQSVHHQLGVGGVQAGAAAVGDDGERVGHVGIGHLGPALRHRQDEVERVEAGGFLRLHLDALAVEEVAQRSGGGRHQRRGRGGWPGGGGGDGCGGGRRGRARRGGAACGARPGIGLPSAPGLPAAPGAACGAGTGAGTGGQ